jgi:methylenetetrahydrofolate reductase (NADPH)
MAAGRTGIEARARILALVRGGSIEVSARDPAGDAQCRELLAPGTSVYINFAPRDTTHGIAAAAVRLRQAGFRPVPHIGARYLAGFTELNDYLARVAGEAGVDQALVIAGDLDAPIGPYRTSLEIIRTGLFEKHGISRIGIAGYPEGHPKLAPTLLDDALAAKLAALRERGIEPYVVTQFCLEAEPILAWIRRYREQGHRAPVTVGLAGPASIVTLAKFVIRCGVGSSLRALARGHGAFARLLLESGPEAIIEDLARRDPNTMPIAGLHLFSFGGAARTAGWLRAVSAGQFAIDPDGDGFRVTADRQGPNSA